AWGSYDAGRIAILKRMADRMWEADSTAYVILEHFGDFFEENELSNYGMMLWRKAQEQYAEASMSYLGNSDFSKVYHGAYGFNKSHAVGFMESHDEERMTYKNKEYGNSSGTYNIKYENIALDRMELCTVFFLSIPGPKLIWQFGELGYDYSINYGGRLGNKPIKWEYYDEPDRKDVYNLYSIMNFLRANYPVFSNGTTGVELSVGNGVAGKRIKLSGAGPNVVILGNFDVVETTVTPAFQHGGRWFEYFRDDTLMVTNTNEGIVLAPGEYRIYTDQKLMESPVAVETVIPRAFVLKQNYPNPFNPKTAISYLLTADSNVELSIYDITGRKITTLVNDYQGAGHYTLQFNASHLASGVYMYKINAGRHSETKKMVVLK
ncbi:MAG: T9SS type A sorting domain-containing protein, partial [Candidatus Marinimicrobia bacterium]|nr:T9SS type A sorting domain-containing protein [Candidatus Neomarinimicrobiota bacterium]